MAKFTVHLRFTGLCAFVKSTSVNRMRVVLVNAQTPMGHHAGDQAHEALLLIDEKNLVNSTTTPTFKYLDDFFRIGFLHAFRLEGVDLSFPAPTAKLVYDPPVLQWEPRKEDCPLDDTQTGINDFGSFDWIAQMPEARDMKQSVFTSPQKSEVLARLSLSAGHLGTSGFRLSDKSGATKIVKWQFQDGAGKYIGPPRAIAEETELIVSVDDMENVFRIDIAPYGGNPKHILLNPASDVVRMWIVNLPLLNVISHVQGDPEAPEVHFLHYYDLSAAGTHYPYKVDYCDPGGGGLTGPKCPTVQFADHADA